MKNIPAVKQALQQDHAITAIPELIVDWNMNRFVGATASNTPDDQDEGFDIEIFPIESIVEPLRPTKGSNKLRIGHGTVGNDEYDMTGAYNGKFYVASTEDQYKYWTSPYQSDTSGNITGCAPEVIYNQNVDVNKIVITTENSWATASVFSIYTRNASGVWGATPIATQTDLGNAWKGSGQMVLYWNGSHWKNFSRSDESDGTPKKTTISGIRIVVTKLEGGYKITPNNILAPSVYIDGSKKQTTGAQSFFDLIEISARLEANLSGYVIDVDDTLDMGEVSNLYPIGTLTSNVASATLSNLYKDASGDWVPGLFNHDNADSPYAKFIDSNAEMKLNYKFYDEDDNYLGVVPQFYMYTNQWTGQSSDTVTVDLSDYAKFFNETTVRAAMWQDLTIPEIIRRVLDSVGFSKYIIDFDPEKITEFSIPVFYTNGESTVWEVLDELAQASQTAIYFDGTGTLRVKTREFAFSNESVSSWNLSSVDRAEELANIVELETITSFEPNHYKVIYQKTNWQPVHRNATMTMQKVWEPEDTEVLRATALTRDLLVGQTSMYIDPNEARIWPYEGIVNVEGELIRYSGKQYVYFVGSGSGDRRTKWIYSEDEHRTKNSQVPVSQRGRSQYSGALKIEERGLWNSEEVNHRVEINGYSANKFLDGHTRIGDSLSGFAHLKKESRVRLNTDHRFENANDTFTVTRGAVDDTPFFNYGTRLKFVGGLGKTHQRAGILIHSSGNTDDGYYIEITPTAMVPNTARSSRNEVMMYTKTGKIYKSLVGTGRAASIAEGIDYELDVSFRWANGNHRIQVWLNGKNVFNVLVAGSDRKTPNGKFGLFARGKTQAEFEYLYAIKREEEPDLLEDFSFLDKVERGYTGNQWDREWVYRLKSYRKRVKRRWRKAQKRFNRQFFDEFGPVVHEVREYDIKFDPIPVLHSRLYLTNDWSAIPLEYSATPFGAKFILANTSRQNAVIHGEDTLSFPGTDDSINQVLTVFGRALVIEEAEEVIAKSDDQIRIRGKNESELTSPWIQNKDMAKDLAKWMRDNFSYGNDQFTVKVFGNPLIEIGDIVTVNYPEKHISGDFFVVGANNAFSNGIETTLTLRRRAV